MINNFQQANEVLAGFVPNTKKPGSYNLDRMVKLMDLLDNPQEKVQVIHVAGTAGKTSTTYYIASFLKVAGKKVGHTVSPHISQVNERVQIGLEPLSEEKFCKYLSEFLQIPGVKELELTYFEVLVGMAFWVFAKEKVDYAVVEVGLGGLLDGTNVVDRPDKICVITDIDYDHVHVLGKTLPEIAVQKAGIIRRNNEVFMLNQQAEIQDVVKRRVADNDANLHIAKQTKGLDLDLPIYQQRNFFLASQVYDFVAKKANLKNLTDTDIDEVKQVVIPGRMEKIALGQKQIILDGAHNPAKFEMLALSLKESQASGEKITFVIGLVQAKSQYLDQIIETIKPIAETVICTKGFDQQDLPHTPLAPEVIAESCKKLGVDFRLRDTPQSALSIAQQQEPNLIVVTGSLYLLGSFKRLF